MKTLWTNLVSWTVSLTSWTDLAEPVTALSGLCLSPRPASPRFKIDEWVVLFLSQSWIVKWHFQATLLINVFFSFFLFLNKCTWKCSLKGICLCSWGNPNVFLGPYCIIYETWKSRQRLCSPKCDLLHIAHASLPYVILPGCTPAT